MAGLKEFLFLEQNHHQSHSKCLYKFFKYFHSDLINQNSETSYPYKGSQKHAVKTWY